MKISVCVHFIFPLDLWLPWGQGRDRLHYSNLVWLSRLVMPHTHKEGIKKCITYVIKLSLGSRLWRRFKSGLGEWLWLLLELRFRARASGLTPDTGFSWLEFPTRSRERECVGFLIGLSRWESRGEKRGAGKLLVSKHQKWSQTIYSLFCAPLLSKQTLKTWMESVWVWKQLSIRENDNVHLVKITCVTGMIAVKLSWDTFLYQQWRQVRPSLMLSSAPYFLTPLHLPALLFSFFMELVD